MAQLHEAERILAEQQPMRRIATGARVEAHDYAWWGAALAPCRSRPDLMIIPTEDPYTGGEALARLSRSVSPPKWPSATTT
jgi:hypothetical protein